MWRNTETQDEEQDKEWMCAIVNDYYLYHSSLTIGYENCADPNQVVYINLNDLVHQSKTS